MVNGFQFLALLFSNAGGIATYFNYNKQLVKIGKKLLRYFLWHTSFKSGEQVISKGRLLFQDLRLCTTRGYFKFMFKVTL